MLSAPTRLGLGVGFDLPWGGAVGFDPRSAAPTPRLLRFLERFAGDYRYLMFSFQPRGAAHLNPHSYLPAYRQLRAAMPYVPLVLHQTTLNLGTPETYDRSEVLHFTNALHAELQFAWVVEDIGIWSHRGLPMPYPLPPFLTEAGLARTIEHTIDARSRLHPRLHIEFPGFTDGFNVRFGTLDAYDYFRRLAETANVDVTLDVGHLLSYRWLCGHRGRALFGELERLPLERCRELHLSGCALVRERFLDVHHGVLLDEQIELCAELLTRCPNLVAVTYEDPAPNTDGGLPAKALPNVRRLKELVGQWMH